MKGCGKIIGYHGHQGNIKYAVICGKKSCLCKECKTKQDTLHENEGVKCVNSVGGSE